MILKFDTSNDEVYYLESTSNSGVALTKWNNTRKYIGRFYE